MTDTHSELDAALNGSGPIAREDVLRWMERASDLPSLSQLYRLTGEHYYRIQPDLGADTECLSIQRYLLECIRLNVEGDEETKDRWEAAETLHLWLRHLLDLEDRSEVITKAAHSITDLFLTSGEDVQIAIEQGFLEHALDRCAATILRKLVIRASVTGCMGSSARVGQGTSRLHLESSPGAAS
jgi:hypothetical protein